MSRLELAGVTKRYGAQAAVDALDLAVPAGSRTAILGPSGCGKTTLLRLVAGFEAPDEGSVTLDGEVLADGRGSLPAHRRRVGIVMQDGALFPHLSVGDNVAFGLASPAPSRHARVAELMELVGLSAAMAARRPDQLSGGQQQRVALARALAREPRLMLLDEPFSALDAGLRASTREAVASLLAARGVTTVLVTHDQAEAMSFADQVAVMREGRIRRIGPARDVYLRPGDAAVAAFLGDAVILDAGMAGGRALCRLGALAVDDPARRGAVRVMLRPEQLQLVAVGTEGAVASRVLAVSFAGSTATARVSVAGETVTLGLPGYRAPEAGDEVHIRVDGPAHVLDG